MKYILLLLGACSLTLLTACKSDNESSQTTPTVNEPSGAEATNNVPQAVPRDLYGRPYPGMGTPADRSTGY